MNNLLAARSQMAMSLAFHIIFAVIGVALPLMMVIAEGLWLRSVGERGGKAPAITVTQMRQVLTRLRGHPAPWPEEIAAVVTRVLRRNEESRIYHWHKATGGFPPRRPGPNTA